MALIGVQRADGSAQVSRLVERLLAYRVFEDEAGKMNLDLTQVNGGLLLVPQFTLAADTGKGNRPSFTKAADPERGKALYNELVSTAKSIWANVETGQFGANMDVSLVKSGARHVLARSATLSKRVARLATSGRRQRVGNLAPEFRINSNYGVS